MLTVGAVLSSRAKCYGPNGEYESRDEYLRELADESGIDYSIVCLLADTLGPKEDFDGLVTSLEDFAGLSF